MLSHLTIENIAVMERAEIAFESGFCVLTGETGAGKSILIDSINAVLGERTSRELIRTGCDRASVSALFCGCSREVLDKVEELGLPVEEDGSVLLQRTLSIDGKSVCRLNGQLLTASMLREVAGRLVHIHGQHDNQALLKAESHMTFIDRLGALGGLLEKYRQSYQQVLEAKKELETFDVSEEEKARRMDLLTYQIEELEAAGIRPGEQEALNARRTALMSAEKIACCLNRAIACLKGDEDTPGACTLAGEAAKEFAQAARFLPGQERPAERLEGLAYELDELGDAMYELLEQSEFSQSELDQIEERLDVLYRLSKKYGSTEEEMLQYLEKAQKELAGMARSEEQLARLQQRLQQDLERAEELAETLSAARYEVAQRLTQAVSQELEELDMPGVRFLVHREKRPLSRQGADKMEFLISANAGEEPRPLSKIASGGELSRIMLAIQRVLAGADDTGTLIFDEIDTGISGRAAQKVGKKLREIAAGRQVVCVTHLAPIAAQGEHQWVIAKRVEDGRTYTNVTPLDGEGRKREIARILGGDPVTEVTLQLAEEMLKGAASSSQTVK